MGEFIKSGEKLTVDTDSMVNPILEAQYKIEKTLSRAQAALNMNVDAQNQYVNSLGKCVEGLTLAQIKLGQYVDEYGKVHTKNGEYVADLTKIEQALGFYADKEGVVYNAQDKRVRLTAEAARKEEDLAKQERIAAHEREEAAMRLREAYSDALQGISGGFSQFSNIITMVDTANGSAQGLRTALVGVSQGIASAVSAAQSVRDVSAVISAAGKQYQEFMTKIPASAGKAAKGIALVKTAIAAMGGSMAAAGAAVSALVAGYATFKAIANDSLDGLPESFQDVARTAHKAKEEIKTVGDALKFGAFAEKKSEVEVALDEVARLEESHLTRVEQDEVDSMRARKTAWGDFWADYSEWTSKYLDHPLEAFGIDHTQKEKNEQLAAVNDYVAKLLEENMSESEKIQREIAGLKNLMENDSLSGKQREQFSAIRDKYEERLKEAKEAGTRRKDGLICALELLGNDCYASSMEPPELDEAVKKYAK